MLFKTSKKQQNTQMHEIKDNSFQSGKYIENLSKSRSSYTLASFPPGALYVQCFPIFIKQKF